ncbi:MAG: DUF3106 domain-containing protein [Candidatus Binatia bacterium]
MRSWGIVALTAFLLAPTIVTASTSTGLGGGGLVGPVRMAQGWDDLTRDQQERAYRNYQRHQKLSPEKRQDVERRYEKWKNLPAADRDRYRKKFDERRRRADD